MHIFVASFVGIFRNRKDLRVTVPGWGQVSGKAQPVWHRLLAFYFHNPEDLNRKQFAKKEVDHTHKHPEIIDWRLLETVEPQRGL